MTSAKRKARNKMDCGAEGCGLCRCCRYLEFLEFCSQVGGNFHRTIETDKEVEAYLDTHYPHWRGKS